MDAFLASYLAIGFFAISPYGSGCGQSDHSSGLVILAAREQRNSSVGGHRGGAGMV